MVKIGEANTNKLSQKRKLNENRGEIYNFFGNKGKFINFWEINGNFYILRKYRIRFLPGKKVINLKFLPFTPTFLSNFS